MNNAPSLSQKPPQKKKTLFQACKKTMVALGLFDILIAQITLLWLDPQEVLRRFILAVLIQSFLLSATYHFGLFEDRVFFGPDERDEA